MFGLLKKLVFLIVFLVALSYALQFRIGDKTVREHANNVYHSPLVRELIRQGTQMVQGYVRKDVGNASGPPDEQVSDRERKALEEVLERETQK